MKIIRATHLGMCFGVKDAIKLALATTRQEPVTVLGDLVHNATVLKELRAAGIQFEQRAESVRTETVMITAHGASAKAINETRQKGLKVLEATCPLVHFAHRSLRRLVDQGFYPVVIGRHDHVEVRGITDDFAEIDVILSAEDIARMKPRDPKGAGAGATIARAFSGGRSAICGHGLPADETAAVGGGRTGATVHDGNRRRRSAQQQYPGAGAHVSRVLSTGPSHPDGGGALDGLVPFR